MKYSLLHLGCQMNQSDAERVRTVLEGLGYEPTEEEKDADLLGIVACSVRQKAIDKVYSRIHSWNYLEEQEEPSHIRHRVRPARPTGRSFSASSTCSSTSPSCPSCPT